MRTDPNELTLLRERVGTLEAALAQAQQENALLRQKVDALVRRVFGARSEVLDPAQLELLLQLVATDAIPLALPPSQRPEPRTPRLRAERAPQLPEHLPVIEQVIDR